LRLTGPPETLVQGLNQTTVSALYISALVDNATAVCADPDILGAFRMAPYWGHYALNDLLFDNGDTYGQNGTRKAKSYACGNSSFAGTWPGSLYCEYRRAFPRRLTKWSNVTEHLFTIVKKRIAEKPKNHGVVVHVRMGDVIDNSSYSVEDMIADQVYYYPQENARWNRYVMPLSHYRNISARAASGQLVTLVGSPHQPDYATWTQPFNKSCVYTYAVAAHLQDLGHRVQVRVGKAPDDDFVFMANSNRFVRGGGRYSKLVGRMVRLNGGEVIETPALSMMEYVPDGEVAEEVELERE